MLTEAEKKWLALRELRHFETGYYMPSFKHDGKTWYDFSVWTDWKAAAEFEARVAVYLAKSPCLTCPSAIYGNCETRKTARGREVIEACRLKHARLAVEEEMK